MGDLAEQLVIVDGAILDEYLTNIRDVENKTAPVLVLSREYINSTGFSTTTKLIESLPRKRVGKPEDLDGLLLLLASEESHFINGAVISADDGMTA